MDRLSAFRAHLALIAAERTPGDTDVYAEGATLTLMYSPEGHTRRLEGGEAIAAFQSRIGRFFAVRERPEPRVQLTEEGLVAEYAGRMTSLESGKPYDQDYVAVVRFEGDRIAEIREYYDPIRVLRATGEME